MTATTISIAMATYNGGRFIEEQLRSFAEQTRLPDELVITDDGSTDDTLKIVEQFAAGAPFSVHINRNPRRLGYSRNFEAAIARCTGDIILLSDQDDVWFETKIARSLEALAGGAALVVNDQIILNPDGKTKGTVLTNIRSLGFPDRTFVTGSCTAMTMDFARLALPFPAGIAYDNWTSILADLLAVRAIIEQPLQLYRRHESNTTNSIFAMRRPTQVDSVLRHGFGDPRPAWSAQIAFLQAYADRIVERRAMAEQISTPESAALALEAIAAEQARYRERARLLDLSKLRRPPKILRMWRAGFYNHFAGWKSAAKDLVRP